ncbi:CueP family metal-binding protein [Ornithinimicrobium sp. Y1847]|uniref:CueP family metal-binding protein n=1 Tax=Ornithinimicrobium sp. Y1847 TaxID=3405419 RepID=UPI003B6743C6
MKRHLPAALLATTVLLAGCAVSEDTEVSDVADVEIVDTVEGTADADAESAPSALPTEVTAMLATYGLEEVSDVRDAVDALDQLDETRPLSVHASVRTDEVIFIDGEDEYAVPVPGDEVYVSIAPYEQHTHECHYHALGGCQGELVDEEMHVTITTNDGDVLVDEEATTWTNGFIGFWLPQDTQGVVSVTRGELSGETEFDTGEGGATCITTLQLS